MYHTEKESGDTLRSWSV